MTRFSAWAAIVPVWAACGVLSAQGLNNQTLKGNYYFRYLSIGAGGSGAISDPRSLQGTITFDGVGGYTFTGQQVTGAAAAVSATGKGSYSLDSAGVVTITNPIRQGDPLNARYSPEALIGAATETTDSTFDLFVAIPAPLSAAALNGPYTVVTVEFPNGSAASAVNTIFSLNNAGIGQLTMFNIYGHAASLTAGAPTTQTISGGSFTMSAAGAGTVSFGSSSALLSGSKNLYVSQSGNVIIGGSTAAGAHDFLIGVKTLANPTSKSWNGSFWTAGLRYESAQQPNWISHTGSVTARGAGLTTLYRRLNALGQGASDFTAADPYTVNPNGLLTLELTQVGLGAGGTFVGSAIDPADPGAFEIYFGAPMASLAGSGVFLNPLGVVSAASFAPAGNPISPGEFIALFGTGLSNTTESEKAPFPTSAAGVTVTINGVKAPIYFVSQTQINCLAPYATTGATASIVVTNSSGVSNTATVRVAATSPGVYSIDQSGTGAGAIEHANGTLVDANHPATRGETVMVFLTGLGAVSPAIADGMASTGSPLNRTPLPIVYVADQQAEVSFSGLAPFYPGLYQINVKIPTSIPGPGTYPLGVLTNNAFHDQVSIAVQ